MKQYYIGYTVSIKKMKEILLCIPRVEGILNRDFIYRHIKKMDVGVIKSIVEKPLRNEYDYKRIIIKMSIDPLNQRGAYILERFSKGENVKLVYEPSNNWKMVSAH